MKKIRTPEEQAELSRKRSEAGRKGAAAVRNHRGGRPKGSTKDPSLKAIPSRTLTVREPDYQVYVKLANAQDVPIVEFMHLNAEHLKEVNPEVFKVPPVKM